MSQDRLNYHWTDADISKYTKEYITNRLKDANFNVTHFDCEASITQRMNKVGFCYLFNIKAVNVVTKKTVEITDYDEYSTVDFLPEEYTKIFTDIFADWKEDALKNRGKAVLETIVTKTANNTSCGKQVKESANTFTDNSKKSLQMFIKVACKRDEFIDLMFKPENVRVWTMNNATVSENSMLINKTLVLDNIVREGFNYCASMKLKDWTKYAKLNIRFYEDKSCTRIHLESQDCELDSELAFRRLFTDLVFNKICAAFRICQCY